MQTNKSADYRNRGNITTSTSKKMKKAQYSILHYVTGNPTETAAVHYPEIPNKHYKPLYYEGLNSVVNSMKDRFDQQPFRLFTQAEQLLLKTVGKQNVTDEWKVLESHFKGDYDAD